MSIHPEALELIKDFEGFRAEPYKCSAGVWTIGYGSTYTPDRERVTRKTLPITEAEASKWLEARISDDEIAVRQHVTVELTDRQIGALVSLVYNIGKGNFARSNALKCLNSGDFKQACKEWAEWRKAGGKVLAGLERRREAELQLFNTKG